MLLKSILEIHPEMLNEVNVRELSWPSHDINIVISKPLGFPSVGVFGIIFLLKHPPPNFSRLSTTSPFKISQYYSTYMILLTSVSTPTPFYSILPHIIRLFPFLCLTV